VRAVDGSFVHSKAASMGTHSADNPPTPQAVDGFCAPLLPFRGAGSAMCAPRIPIRFKA
jgi:hypothetical protein